ncbi:MAG TPA: hypothetical protein PK103_09670 [Elusimicrobiales bacterium]|nr:hypothetical protein [Elusimicrobiales bacterium]
MNIKSLHQDQALTNFSLKYQNDEFVGTKLFPELSVVKESGKYFEYGREAFKRYNTKVSPTAKAPQKELTIKSQKAYDLNEYKISDFITQREIDNADEPLNLELDVTSDCLDTILLDLECDIASAALNPNNYVSGQVEGLNIGDKWSDYTNSNPVKKIDTMRSIIKKNLGGVRPNTLLVSEDVHDILKEHPVLLNKIKYTQFGRMDDEAFKKAFEVENYIVAGATYDSEKENVSGARTTKYIWENSVILAYVNPRVGIRSVSFGYTFRKEKGRQVLVEEHKNPLGKLIIAQDLYDVRVVCPFAGYLLTGVVS